jgi:hypothetical protein
MPGLHLMDQCPARLLRAFGAEVIQGEAALAVPGPRSWQSHLTDALREAREARHGY